MLWCFVSTSQVDNNENYCTCLWFHNCNSMKLSAAKMHSDLGQMTNVFNHLNGSETCWIRIFLDWSHFFLGGGGLWVVLKFLKEESKTNKAWCSH